MGMFGSSAPAIPMSPQDANYKPSPLDIGLQVLFGGGAPADAAAHLRELHYQQAMRPVQAQAFQDWMGNFGPQGDPQAAQPPAPQAPPPQAAPDPQQAPDAEPDLPALMANGLGAAVTGQQPLVPQIGATPASAPAPAAPAAPAASAHGAFNPFDLSDPRVRRQIVGGKAFGMPGADTVLDIAKATQPDVQYDRGFGYDKKTGRQVAGYHPDLEKGQIPLYDANGNLAGVKNLDGTVQAAAQMSEATELGKTRGGIISAPTGNGGSRMMTGAQYLDMTNPPAPVGGRHSGPLVPQRGGAGPAGSPAGSPAGGLGYTPSPAEQELAKGRVATQVEREKLQPKEAGALRDLDSASSLTSDTIHQILGDVKDPKTGQWIVGDVKDPKTGQMMPGPKSMARWNTVGLAANLKGVDGTPAHNLDELLEHVNAATSMANLQNLRDNSPTGAGLGRVTQTEIGLLAAMNGSTDQGQTGPQFTQNLRRQLTQLDAAVANRHKVYAQTYGHTGGGAGVAPPSSAVAYLKANPNLAAAFDAKYGAGASRSVLGQ